MANCKCSLEILTVCGVTESSEGLRCNYCKKIASQAMVGQIDSTPRANSGVLRAAEPDSRLAGINSIVLRMWIWISVQAIFIGIWAGNAFPSLNSGYYSDSYSFSVGNFMLGTIIGFGAFAPLVFVVEALREIVRNIAKGH